MKIANTINYTTGKYENQTMLIRPYKLTHEGARRIIQRDVEERFDGLGCNVNVCVTRISTMIVTQ
jgi:hypothetical protein